MIKERRVPRYCPDFKWDKWPSKVCEGKHSNGNEHGSLNNKCSNDIKLKCPLYKKYLMGTVGDKL